MEGAISSLKRAQNASKGFISPVISLPVSAIAAEAPPPPPPPPGSTTFSSSMPSVAFAFLAAPPAALLTLWSFLPAASACAKVCPKIEAIKAATARVAFASPCIRAVRAGRTASRMGANAVRRLFLTLSNAALNSLLCPAAPDIRLFIARKNAYSPAVLTFMMSQAQAESESLSGNVRWGHRKNFKDGKVYYHCKNFLGYRWGADGQPEIDPEQAAIVRRIFSRFLLGHSVRQITTDLMADGIKTATGKTVWHDSVVQKMLCNEKYIGDALLQKTYIADLFTREKRVNNGELPKYYVHDCHPAIIDRETFQKVQEEIARRSSLKKTSSKAKTQLGKYCGKYVLSELLVCGECGSPYRRVIWTQKGAKRVVWRCQNRLEHGRKICKQSPTLDEGDIHDAVISAMNELFRMQAAKDAVKAGIAAVLAGEEQTLSLPAVEHQIRNLQERQLELFQLIVSAGADCTDYDEELQQVYMAKTKLMAQKAELEKEHRGAAAFDSRLAELDMALEQASGALTDFDELTVRQLVSNIKVLDKDSLLICFKDGTEITQTIQRRRSA